MQTPLASGPPEIRGERLDAAVARVLPTLNQITDTYKDKVHFDQMVESRETPWEVWNAGCTS